MDIYERERRFYEGIEKVRSKIEKLEISSEERARLRGEVDETIERYEENKQVINQIRDDLVEYNKNMEKLMSNIGDISLGLALMGFNLEQIARELEEGNA